jgi:hypothetical protein
MTHHERIESFAAMSASLLAQLNELSALGSLFVSSGVNRLKLAWKILRLRHVSLSDERVPENFATLSVGRLVGYP